MTKLASIIAMSLAVASCPALADTEVNRVAVDFGDLDLTKEAGRKVLDLRLERAVRKVCDAQPSRSVRIASETRQCLAEKRVEVSKIRDEVIAEAQAKASRETLAISER